MRKRTAIPVLFAAVGLMLAGPAGTASASDEEVAEPDYFTSAYTAMATPDMVINNEGVATSGTAGAYGTFNYRINSDLEIICYDIEITGITAPFQSPARTATHIHEAAVGKAGPPRLAFPNPVEQADGTFVSKGCMAGPFTTGIVPDGGVDTGQGFTLAQIEANPSAFFTDTHTQANPAGAVRGQLVQVPVGGADTGAGGSADTDAPLLPIGLGLIAMAGVGFGLRHAATR